jgi:hypothetical protein
LLYLAKIYEKIVSDRNLYGSKLVKIPRPEFWVLYNGTAPYPDRQTLRLSDSFETALSLGVPEKTVLELEVQVVNINEGRNADIARRCETLAQYSAFIDKARSFMKETGDREEAIRKTIKYCRDHDILKEFLEKHATEVLNMMLEEYTVEDAMTLMREEGREEDIRNLIVFGMTPEQVSEALRLPPETVMRYL